PPPVLPSFPTRRSSDLELLTDRANGFLVTRQDFKFDLNAYLAAHPSAPVRTLEEVLASGTPPSRRTCVTLRPSHPATPRSTWAQDRKSTRLNSSHDQIS